MSIVGARERFRFLDLFKNTVGSTRKSMEPLTPNWRWYDDALNYGGSPPNAYAFIYHPQWGLHMSPQGGVHMQALKQVPRDVYYGLTEKGVFGRAFPYGNISGSMGPHGSIYQGSGPFREEAKQAVEDYFNKRTKTASPNDILKFLWEMNHGLQLWDWRDEDYHHINALEDIGYDPEGQWHHIPYNYCGGLYYLDDGTVQITEENGEHPDNEEMSYLIKQELGHGHYSKTASLPHKFVWADGQMAVGPGWRKDIHHMHLMQELGLTTPPQNMYAGTYMEDPFSDRATIIPDWDAYGSYPSDEELIEQVRQRLRPTAHMRGARKPW